MTAIKREGEKASTGKSNKTHRRLPLTSDIVFKAVYGRDTPESKAALIALLNILLDRTDDPIQDLVYKNPFTYADCEDAKTIIMDIKVVTRSGEWIGVEMQVGGLEYFIGRTVLYHAKLTGEQLESGESYDKIKKSIVVSILRGTILPQSEKALNVFRYKEVERNFELTGISELIYLELDKINTEKPPETMTPLEVVGAYLCCAGVEGKETLVKQLVEQGMEVVSMSENILNKISEDERLRQLQISRDLYQAFQRYSIGEARERGVKEGRRSSLLEAAVRMKAAGLDLAQIEEFTGLQRVDIEKL